MTPLREYPSPATVRPSSDDAILCTPDGIVPGTAATEDNPPTGDGQARLAAASVWQRVMRGDGDAQA